MSLSGRTSYIGSSKPDPVLSSFSPLGSSRIRDFRESEASHHHPSSHPNSSVAQIQPRTSTPVHSSGISRTVVMAEDHLPEDSTTLSTPLSSAARVPAPTESLKRLSISGRLSYGGAGGQGTPAPLSLVSHSEGLTDRLRDRFESPLTAPHSSNHHISTASGGGRDSTEIPSRGYNSPAGMSRGYNDPTETSKGHTSPLEPSKSYGNPTEPSKSYNNPIGSSKPHGNSTTSSMAANRTADLMEKYSSLAEKPVGGLSTSSTSVISSSAALPDMIRGFIESSISSFMQEIRNDVQNLHVDLIKQSLAQQNTLRQILATLPDSYNKIAQENQSLREEVERLRLRLGQL